MATPTVASSAVTTTNGTDPVSSGTVAVQAGDVLVVVELTDSDTAPSAVLHGAAGSSTITTEEETITNVADGTSTYKPSGGTVAPDEPDPALSGTHSYIFSTKVSAVTGSPLWNPKVTWGATSTRRIAAAALRPGSGDVAPSRTIRAMSKGNVSGWAAGAGAQTITLDVQPSGPGVLIVAVNCGGSTDVTLSTDNGGSFGGTDLLSSSGNDHVFMVPFADGASITGVKFNRVAALWGSPGSATAVFLAMAAVPTNVAGATATEHDTVNAGALTGPTTIAGTAATENDAAHDGATSAGGTTVVGTVATEHDSPHAGSVSNPPPAATTYANALYPDGDIDVNLWEGPAGETTNLYQFLTGETGDFLTARAGGGTGFNVIGGTLPGQVGAVTTYTTTTGTIGYMRTCYVPGHDGDDKYAYLSILPASLDSTVATPHVVYLHGATADENNGIFGGGFAAHTGPMQMLDDWLDRGWGVISLREGSEVGGNIDTDLWANYACRTAMVETLNAYTALFAQHSHGVCVYGVSMGGLAAFNLVVQAKLTATFSIAAVVMIDPAISAQYVYDIRKFHPAQGPLSDAFAAAYGLTELLGSPTVPPASTWTPDGTWVTAVDSASGTGTGIGHDGLVVALADLDVPPFHARMPFYVLHSVGDLVIDEDQNGQLFSARLTSGGWTGGSDLVDVETTRGHANVAHFIPSTQSGFFVTWLAV